MSHPVLADATHVLIAGVTGAGDGFGGKTSTAAWWLDHAVPGHFRYGVAFSPKGHRFDFATTVTSPLEAAEAIGDGARVLEWTIDGSPMDVDNLEDAHAQAMSFASGLEGDVLAVHDDAVRYSGADSLEWCTALAGNPAPGDDRIKSLVVTQDAWDLPRRGVRSNLPVFVWVGPLSDEGEKFLKQSGKGKAAEVVRKRHTVPYRWSIIDGDGRVDTFDPVPEQYA